MIARILQGAAGLLLAALSVLAQAGELSQEDIARRFPPPLRVAAQPSDLPVWPISSELRPDDGPIAYVFESVDFAPIPGFEGTPINLLVAIDGSGKFIDVALLRQHEPVFLGGLGEEPLPRDVCFDCREFLPDPHLPS